jgi:3-oxoadipyl-CoA thiolase
VAEAYVVDAIRTPMGAYRGALAGVRPDDLAAQTIAAVVERTGVDPERIADVYFGAANQSGEDNRDVARMAALLAGLPHSVPGATVNRLCASGLEAVNAAARAVKLGEGDHYLAGGVESMSRAPWVVGKPERGLPRGPQTMHDTTLGWRFVNPRMAELGHSTETMGETGENVAERYGISREDQDAFGLRSHQRAVAAAGAGIFAEEIVAVEARQGRETVTVEADEGPRADASLEKMAKLRPAFREGGTVTAGNAAGVNDGAAALLLASAEGVRRHNLTPFARIGRSAAGAVAPSHMGIGPVAAVERLTARGGPYPRDCAVVEINEAFAAQVLACLRAWGIPDDDPRVNAYGGGIALGHPLGMSGARIAAAAGRRLAEEGGDVALATLCVGVGQGVALEILPA